MLTTSLLEPALISFTYLLGSIPTALLVCNSMGIPDPRQQGSGNPGASNVLRIGNRVAATLTLLGDISKGVLAVYLALLFDLTTSVAGLCGLAAILGHVFPLLGAYRGGKGIATFIGCTLVLSWPIAVVQILVWLIMASLFRIASLASITMTLATPISAYFLYPDSLSALLLISLLLIARHQSNIMSLIKGTERRF